MARSPLAASKNRRNIKPGPNPKYERPAIGYKSPFFSSSTAWLADPGADDDGVVGILILSYSHMAIVIIINVLFYLPLGRL